MKSKRTKHCRNLKILFTIFNFLCMFGPCIVFVVIGYKQGETAEKLTLSMTIVLAIVLAVLGLILDVKHRGSLHKSILWILVLGIMSCLEEVKNFIYVLAIVSLVQELLISRLKDRYSELTRTNKEIDRRG